MSNEGGNSGLVCQRELGAFDADRKQCYETLIGEFGNQVEEMKELEDGYAFRVNGESASIVKLAEWVTLERLCCTFFKFTLEVESESGPVWLSLTGRPGVKELLRSEIEARHSN